jgi:four helix bundle protein
MKFDIRERAKKFAIRVIMLIKKLPKDVAGYALGGQLIRSGISIGANLEEADAASSRKDFFHKVSISYKEAKESRYWLELILESNIFNHRDNIKECEELQKESVELSKILFSIVRGKEKEL